MRIISALPARRQLGQIMHWSKKHRVRFIVQKKGEPQVVIMSIDDYRDTVGAVPDFTDPRGQKPRAAAEALSARDLAAQMHSYVRKRQGQQPSRKDRP
jgi:hypothetical protein